VDDLLHLLLPGGQAGSHLLRLRAQLRLSLQHLKKFNYCIQFMQ
jgi:hypothetical protein